MVEHLAFIGGLALGTFAIRLGGYLLGATMPSSGRWARALQALPGCLIAALLATILVQASLTEWAAALIALAVALVSRSLPLTMAVGVGAVYVLRNLI